MKSYTDIEQSHKLAEILPMESADMRYDEYISYIDGTPKVGYKKGVTDGIPCWSFAALFDLLPNNEHIETTISRGGWKIEPVEYMPNTWWCEYEDTKNQTEFNISADNPVDACYKMILKLNEQELL